MANAWFRMYAEIRSDPKVRTMPEPYQLRLVWLLAMRCEGLTERLTQDELCYGLSCDETFLSALHSAFLDKGFIEEDWSIRNWNKRQLVSDSSTERVREFRARKGVKQSETLQKRYETQSVTDQNRTEQIQNRTKLPTPKAVAFVVPEWVSGESWSGFVEMRKKIRAPLTDRAAQGILRELESLRLKGHDPGAVLDQSTERCWRGIFEIRAGGSGNGHYETRNERITRETLEKLDREEAQHAGQSQGRVSS